MNHTPGPWKATKTKLIVGVNVAPGWAIAPKGISLDIAQVHLSASQNPKTQEANANLIAAAPDLLAALQHITNLQEEMDGTSFEEAFTVAEDIARKAVAKAKGGAS